MIQDKNFSEVTVKRIATESRHGWRTRVPEQTISCDLVYKSSVHEDALASGPSVVCSQNEMGTRRREAGRERCRCAVSLHGESHRWISRPNSGLQLQGALPIPIESIWMLRADAAALEDRQPAG